MDLRKLHWSIGLDLVSRYHWRRACHDRLGSADEVEWIQKRLQEHTP